MIRTDRLEIMDESDLRELNAAIVAEINRRVRRRKEEAMSKLNVGDMVAFMDRSGKLQHMIVKKINRATIDGYSYNFAYGMKTGTVYRVSASAVTKVERETAET